MNIYFLFGFFDGLDQDNIILNSKGNVQNAANVLQKKYISGFLQCEKVSKIEVINLPYLGSYPKYYKKINFKTVVGLNTSKKLTIHNVNYCNLMIYKNLSRMMKSFFRSYKVLKSNNKEDALFFIYAMHLPFLIAAFFLKMIFSETKFFVIVPDLPEFMANRKGFIAIFYNNIAKFSYKLVNSLDGVVVITEKMKDKFSNGLDKVVIEGIASNNDFDEINNCPLNKENFFLYSGTLDNRYGLDKMIESFSAINVENFSLYICGEGPDKRTVLDATNKNKNIKYLGILHRDEVLILQQKAKLLINPRTNDGEYTQYSFPSKTLEYMSSGTPVLMYKLSGIPNEYYDYVYTIENTADAFSDSLRRLALTDLSELQLKGNAARKFVEKYKNPAAQVNKIFDTIIG